MVSDQHRGWALPQPLHVLNEGLAFVLELLMLAGLAWWGAEAVSPPAGRVALAVAAPALAAVIWGLFCAPRARFRLPVAGVLAVKTAVFCGAAVAVYALGQHALAIGFAVVALANMAVAAIDRDARARPQAG